MASKSSPWGAAGWWIIFVMSVPFSLYAAVFVIGDFEVYKKMTLSWGEGKYDTAGLNILHHIRAWQIHSLAAEFFISTGLFQFSPSFRRKYPQIHRVMGYIFVAAGVVCSFTGVFFLIPYTEFGRLARVVFIIQALAMCYFLLIAVQTAKKKKFQVHQRYMIRAAATGYAILSLRLLPGLFVASGLSFRVAMELSALIAPIIFLSVSELYIRRVLLQPKVRTSSDGVQSVQTSPPEEPKFIPSPNSNESKELRTEYIQAGWPGEQTHLGSSKSGGWVGEA
ncbi:unnamed protein product [Calypogeia fissa]